MTAALRVIADRPSVRSLVRACCAAAIGAADRTPVAKVALREWSDDRGVEWLTRAPSSITDTASAPALVHTVMPDFISTLATSSAAARFFKEGLQLTFDHAGRIAVPTIFGNTAYSAFVQEGAAIPLPAVSVEPLIYLTPRKLATIVVLTSEMVRSSNIEVLMTDALIRSTGLALDAALFDANPDDGARPAGLRYGITASTASAAPDPVAALMSDIETLSHATVTATRTYPIYVSDHARAQAMELRSTHGLRPLIVLGSFGLSMQNILIAVAPDNLVSVLGAAPEIRAIREAAVEMDTAPVGGAPSKSLWQTDCIAVLVKLPVTWGMRSAAGVAWLTITNW